MTAQTAYPSLPAFAVFAAMLSAAGLPLYMHAPKFFVDEYGVSLAALGGVLFVLRLLDVVQDPLLGQVSARLRARRGGTVFVAGALMALGIFGLFGMAPLFAPLWWFAVMLTLVFTSFSYLTICFYAQGVSGAATLGEGGHIRLARWRETGALIGICAAAVAPVLFGSYAVFALSFGVLAIIALLGMRTQWRGAPDLSDDVKSELRIVVQDPVARRLLFVALANSAPVAVSSTLFLFFVADRLKLPGWEGAFLLLFFVSAACAAPIWGRLAENFDARRVLLSGMVLSIAAFGYAIMLGPGDALAFGIICVASGIALGADMTLLPALFATRLGQVAPGAAVGFSLWSFVSKMSLAFAAVALLPLLEFAGYTPGQQNSDRALFSLALLYGAVPCFLKFVAIMLLAGLPASTIAPLSPSIRKGA
ncbi:MAG: MFS transporter [Pseudomonadota bacterium]